MAARNLENGYYGSVGMADPMSSFDDVTLRVAWDFGKKSVPENKTIPLMQIPKGFLIERISLVQTKGVNAATTVTFGLASSDSVAVGGNFALGTGAANSPLLRSSQAPASVATSATVTGGTAGETVSVAIPGSLFVEADDILCMIVPDGVTGDELNAGSFDLCVRGYRVFAEQLTANPLKVESYRNTLQDTNNVSGGQWPLD